MHIPDRGGRQAFLSLGGEQRVGDLVKPEEIIGQANKRGIGYSFLFMRPDGRQLAEIGELLETGRVRPVIDKVFPFDETKEALAYLEQGRAKGKVVVQLRSS